MGNRLRPDHADRLREQPLTYAEVGATLGQLPAGYHHLNETFRLGSGAAFFDEASARLMRWQVQRGAGLRVSASSDVIEEGVVAIVRIGPGPFALTAPVRVVTVIDEATRRGFVYGTLAGHPEQGEEAFVLEFAEGDDVVLRIVAFSRPASWVSRSGGPVSRAVQRAITRRYGRALLRD